MMLPFYFKTWCLHYPQCSLATEWHHWQQITCSFFWSHKKLYTTYFPYAEILLKTCKHTSVCKNCWSYPLIPESYMVLQSVSRFEFTEIQRSWFVAPVIQWSVANWISVPNVKRRRLEPSRSCFHTAKRSHIIKVMGKYCEHILFKLNSMKCFPSLLPFICWITLFLIF